MAIRKELLITAGEMADLAGGLLCSNLRRFDEAGQYLKLAYDAAREAGDVELEANVLGLRSWLAHNVDDRRSALEFAEVAVTAARQGTHQLPTDMSRRRLPSGMRSWVTIVPPAAG